MRNRLMPLLAGTLLTVTAGCAGDPLDAVAADTVAVIKEFNDVSDTVKDRASAEAAKAQLEAAVQKMQAVKKRRQDLGQATPEQAAAIKQKYDADLSKESGRFFASLQRMSANPEMKEPLQGVMEQLKKAKPF